MYICIIILYAKQKKTLTLIIACIMGYYNTYMSWRTNKGYLNAIAGEPLKGHWAYYNCKMNEMRWW